MQKEITSCRICKNKNLKEIINLGTQALTGIFKPKGCDVPRGELRLVQCSGERDKTCGLLQLKHQFDPHVIYGNTYGYRSGLNATIVEHLKNKHDYLINLIDLKRNDVVVDIGSNDGTLLNFFSDCLKRIGVDPLISKFRKYYSPDILTSSEFFSSDSVSSMVLNQKVKLVTSISMFYDVDEPLKFMQDIANVLSDDGVWFFEQSYLPTMIKQNAYDTICHEHLTYYGLKQIKWMTDQVGLKIIDVGLTDLNGGSFYVATAKKESFYPESHLKIKELLDAEEELSLDGFKRSIETQRQELMDVIHNIKRQDQTIVGFGASTKGNVILQYCGMTTKELDCIVEVNEQKYGCATPGTDIPIISQDELRRINPDYVLVLPWHFKDFILSRRDQLFNRHCRIIFPLPQVQVIEGVNIDMFAKV